MGSGLSDEVFGALFMRIEIRGGFAEEFWIVLKAAEALVALAAEKRAYVALLVAVVHREF